MSISLNLSDGLLNRAFQLACFIVGERDTALHIVVSALAKLEVAVGKQGKRLYYIPTGRSWSRRTHSNGSRNNILFNELHLLQRLIYIESEPYETVLEQQSSNLVEEDLIIHFIKHLTKKTVKRNSFYVTLGMSRILYSYSTAEAMDIFNAVIQDPERVKDDYYYRSRRGILMQELKQRFGDLINICRGPRGEERFQTEDNPSRFVELIRECLTFFTPWNTPCLVPTGIDPIIEGISSFSDAGNRHEDEIEINRIHAVLHPDCFSRLIEDLRLDAPDKRLNIPRFFHKHDINNDGSNSRRHQPELSEQELTSVRSELATAAARRKAAHASLLRVIVDGNERARFDPSETYSTRLHLELDNELIEVRSYDEAGEEVLLALHPILYDRADDKLQPIDTSITLEGGQKISILVSPGERDATVDISYRETNALRATSLFVHRFVRSINPRTSRMFSNGRRILTSAAAVILFVIGVLAIITYVQKGHAPDQNQVAINQQVDEAKEPAPARATASTDNKPSISQETDRGQPGTVGLFNKKEPSGNPIGQKAESQTTSETATEAEAETRSVKAVRVLPLSGVKQVYVETIGDENHNLHRLIEQRLRASNRVNATPNREEADALLELSLVKGAGTEGTQVTVIVQLINARGKTIWPKANSTRRYQGSASDITLRIVNDLLSAVQNAKQ
jgi:hypothetical protein